MISVTNNPRSVLKWSPYALWAIAAGALGYAFYAQYADGLEPCNLCLYQRYPFAIVAGLGLIGLFIEGDSVKRALIGLSGLVFLSGAAIAIYHVGVEQHWWASAVCGGTLDASGSLTTDQFMAQLQGAPIEKACDDVDWTFLGLSMATWNVAFSGILGMICLWLFVALKNHTTANTEVL